MNWKRVNLRRAYRYRAEEKNSRANQRRCNAPRVAATRGRSRGEINRQRIEMDDLLGGLAWEAKRNQTEDRRGITIADA